MEDVAARTGKTRKLLLEDKEFSNAEAACCQTFDLSPHLVFRGQVR